MANSHKCCQKQKLKRGLWSPDEDEKLRNCIMAYGARNWNNVPTIAGIQRCGKSCRLRWINYLRPDLKRGSFSAAEERHIIELHKIFGNKWSKIASHLPGRTDNEIKNIWNSCLRKRVEKKASETSEQKSSTEISRTSEQDQPLEVAQKFSTMTSSSSSASWARSVFPFLEADFHEGALSSGNNLAARDSVCVEHNLETFHNPFSITQDQATGCKDLHDVVCCQEAVDKMTVVDNKHTTQERDALFVSSNLSDHQLLMSIKNHSITLKQRTDMKISEDHKDMYTLNRHDSVYNPDVHNLFDLNGGHLVKDGQTETTTSIASGLASASCFGSLCSAQDFFSPSGDTIVDGYFPKSNGQLLSDEYGLISLQHYEMETLLNQSPSTTCSDESASKFSFPMHYEDINFWLEDAIENQDSCYW
ncbi:hypothetical protein KP509_08G000700 [Ceratopteris richardii]|uniref:Uncharacterized protein n=1 Tax=Ceratopteris richardii TaxID=49495 RepID=A0A8T2UAZ0_CERRI|nr:hypothetical protein KP509_08G000700 [Ceratopteris richardii]